MPSIKDIYLKGNSLLKGQGKKICYVQPEIRQSMRPVIGYKQPTLPFLVDTIQKTSYLPIDSNSAAKCKMKSIRPIQNINSNASIKMDSNSITSLSYQPINNFIRAQPIEQRNCLVKSSEPLEKITTHNHDFSFKIKKRMSPVYPSDNILKCNAPINQETTMKLSYQHPGCVIPIKKIKQEARLESPNITMNTDTCYKLSFLPIHTKQREIPPWAMKSKFARPLIPFDDITVQKSSYQPPGTFIEIDSKECTSSYSDPFPKAFL